MFHALADPTRRRMVEQLSLGPASVTELAAPLPITMSAVVQHLAVLQDSGLVTSEKVGRVRTCRVAPKALDLAGRWIADRRSSWQDRFDRLGALLDAEDAAVASAEPGPTADESDVRTGEARASVNEEDDR